MDGAADQVALAMLAMAENFRLLPTPKVKMAIKCARGALKLPISAPINAHVHLQLGKLLVFYTENYEEAKTSLEFAYNSMESMGEYFVAAKMEALLLLCDVYIHGISTPTSLSSALTLIRHQIAAAKDHPQILSKLLFYYIEAAMVSEAADQAVECCDLGISSFRGRDSIQELYFRMTKALVYSRLHETQLSDQENDTIQTLMTNLDQNSPHAANLRMYYICIQLTSMLNEGKTRSSKAFLRTMQVDTQRLNDQNVVQNGIRWMDQVPMTAFACLMTIASAAYQCSMDRVMKYFGLVLRHINEYLVKAAKSPCEHSILRCVQRMRLVSNEFVAQCYIMACKPNDAMLNIRDMVTFSSRLGPDSKIAKEFEPVIQSLLAHYCLYLRDFDKAEKHFKAALESKFARQKNIWIMTHANLGLLYLTQCKHAEYYDIADRLLPNRVNPCTLVVQTNVRFVQAFHYYLLNKITDFQKFSESCLETAKTEDMFRIYNLTIMLCSPVLPVLTESLHSCISWSGKGQDHVLHHWNNASVAKILQLNQQDGSNFARTAAEEEKHLQKETLLQAHRENPAHNLIEWYGGDAAAFLPKDD